MLPQTSVIGEIVDGMVVEQRLPVGADHAEAVNIMVATFGRANTGILHVDICGEDGRTLASVQGKIEDMVDNHVMRFEIPNGIADLRQENVALRIWSEGCHPGNAITLYYGNSVRSGRFDVQKQISEEELYRVNGTPGNGSLCAYFNGYNDLIAYKLYWPLKILIFAVTAIIFPIWWKQAEQGKWNPLTMLCSMVFKYGFLTRQLVSRDFKTKYKRSVLGVGWSILNPLLTMLVHYVVFSTLFSNGTKNYPVYLLTGIVFFSFFSEAINMGMSSITSNAALIKKVYVPKYIFPVSRVLSSLINLGTSMIPLLAVMLLTGNLAEAFHSAAGLRYSVPDCICDGDESAPVYLHGLLSGYAVFVGRGKYDLDVPDAYLLYGYNHSGKIPGCLSYEPHVSVHQLCQNLHYRRRFTVAYILSVVYSGGTCRFYRGNCRIPEESRQICYVSVR